MKTPNFQPFRDRYLVRPLDEDNSPIKVAESERAKPVRGHIVAVGGGALLEDGRVLPMTFEAGTEILFGKYAGSDQEFDGVTFKIISEAEIFGHVPQHQAGVDE